MENSELVNIKNQILKLSPDKWWGDDFDVRFYLISKLSDDGENNLIISFPSFYHICF